MNGLPKGVGPIQSSAPMVPSGILRAGLVASLVLALWTLARPALASSAPFCDDRGASAIAMPPALDAPDEAIARARSCTGGGDALSLNATVVRWRLGATWGMDGPAAALPRGVILVCAVREAFDPAERTPLASGGVTSRVERPPRG
jgi:hypothetical protein